MSTKYYSYLGYFLLTLYCAILISLEITISQKFVRNFFTDIEGSVHFYAVNTSLSVFLLLATALIFAASLVSTVTTVNNRQQIFFYRSQILFFGYLALDDRFLIHEKIRYVLNTNDIFIFLGLGILELILIVLWGNFSRWNNRIKNNLYKAAFCFAVMVAVDTFYPSEMVPRLSLEDLSKTWANTFLFLFSWEIFKHNITLLKHQASPRKSNK